MGNEKALSRSAIRRQREREERYQTILRAAEKLFYEEGYHQTSINKISDLAEVSVGTVYFYFKNKEDLLVHLLDEISFLFRSRIGKEFKNTGESLDGIMKAGYLFFDEFCRLFPEKLAIMYRESVGQSTLVNECRMRHQEKIIEDVKGAILQAAEKMGFMLPGPDSAEVIAVSITGLFDSIASHFLFSQKRSGDLKSIGDDAITFLIGGIKHMFIPKPDKQGK